MNQTFLSRISKVVLIDEFIVVDQSNTELDGDNNIKKVFSGYFTGFKTLFGYYYSNLTYSRNDEQNNMANTLSDPPNQVVQPEIPPKNINRPNIKPQLPASNIHHQKETPILQVSSTPEKKEVPHESVQQIQDSPEQENKTPTTPKSLKNVEQEIQEPTETIQPPPDKTKTPIPPPSKIATRVPKEPETEEEKSATAITNVFGVSRKKESNTKKPANRLKNMYAQPFY